MIYLLLLSTVIFIAELFNIHLRIKIEINKIKSQKKKTNEYEMFAKDTQEENGSFYVVPFKEKTVWTQP